MYDCNILPPSGASEVVLLDREPLALRCALLSAAASGLRLAAEGKLRDCGAATRSAEEGSGPPCCSSPSSLEPEPLQGWTPQQQHQNGQRQQQREGQEGAGGGASQSSDECGAQVAAEAVSRTLQRVMSGVERATAGAASGGTGSTVAGGAAVPPSAGSDGEAPRRSGSTSDSSPAAAAAAEAAPAFAALVCSVTGKLRLPEFCFEGAAAIARLMEGQLPSSSSEGHQGPGEGSGTVGEGDRVGIMGSVKRHHSSVEGISSRNGVMRARVFDWNHADLLGEQYDVLLACDVLYEDAAVGPIAALVPRWDDETSGCSAL